MKKERRTREDKRKRRVEAGDTMLKKRVEELEWGNEREKRSRRKNNILW